MTAERIFRQRTEAEPQFDHDIYLAGPWEEHVQEPYKALIKEAFPGLDIYDPEDNQEGDWMAKDLQAIYNSKYFICYAPSFPMSATTFEMGYFYAKLNDFGLVGPNLQASKIIVIWSDEIKPIHGKKWYERAAIVVPNTQEAINILHELEPAWNLDRS